ncbi:hypothetical protein J2X63_001624 [Agromyces sp. 3263]|uniref:MarR family winged helix-turn-helix transcriptional regulator n=1 Tax=Agromyces sp. 3263 TaxID=2817750 RepID=UPI002866C904|nr:hypothetical protein [Agromyces sp. 3263]MDR6905938.1 hypothetical protein [Agromyces sp. 3263]
MTTDHLNPDQPDGPAEDQPREASADEAVDREASAPTGRPFGFWLKVVDRRISEEMEELFAADGITRRDWRVLNLLAGEVRDERLAERLRAKPHALHRLAERGWIDGAPPEVTDAGREARDRLEEQVRTLRERIAGAVPADDFAATLRTLEAVARELGWDDSQQLPRGGRGGRGWRRHGFGGWHGRSHGGHGYGHHEGHGHDGGFGHEGHRHGADVGPRPGFGPGPGFGPRPGFGPQPSVQDVHVHVHVHEDRRHKGHGRRHHDRPNPEA